MAKVTEKQPSDGWEGKQERVGGAVRGGESGGGRGPGCPRLVRGQGSECDSEGIRGEEWEHGGIVWHPRQ